MINIKYSEVLKIIAQLEVNLIPTGIMFLFIENRTIKWKVVSERFDLDIFKVGSDVTESTIAVRAIDRKSVV